MFRMSFHHTAKQRVVGMIFVLSTCGLCHAQEAASESTGDIEVDVYDEIIVEGEPTLGLLREEVYEAEENFYDMFNALNKGKRYDIHCFFRVRVGSQVRRRFCRANFLKSEYMPPEVVGAGALRAYVRHRTRQMYQMMSDLMQEHPDLHAALMEFSDKKQTLDAAVHDRCVNSPLTCDDDS